MNKTIQAANYKFNKWLNENTGQYAPPTGYGEFNREILDFENQLVNHSDELYDFAKMLRENK